LDVHFNGSNRGDRMSLKPTIIPIASGKGGVGKSFISANLAAAIAQAGHETIIVDLDLGGTNVYGFLGLQNQHAGIGDFLKARSAELDQLMVPTSIPRLSYIPGDGRTPFMANIAYAQKIRLISKLKKLPVEYVLLDLSAGSSFNTIDFFRISPLGLMVTVPEYPAIMNLLTFLRLTLMRVVERRFRKNEQIRLLLAESCKRPLTELPAGISDLKSIISTIDPSAEKIIDRLCTHFRPRLIFNKGEHPDEMRVYRQIDEGLTSVLSIQADYFGFVFRDPMVRRSVNSQQPYLLEFPDSQASKAIRKIAERIIKYWRTPVEGSARIIMEQAAREFQRK
jgi:flagellar biosynthesis protein FlhG